jgi:metallo-beta-lactamase class B
MRTGVAAGITAGFTVLQAPVLVGLMALQTLAAASENPSPRTVSLSDDLQLEELAPGVWQHISWTELEGFGRTSANGLVVVGQKDAALIDTPWTDELTSALFTWVEENLGSRITVVGPTHSHGDNLGGLAAAHSLGAASYAHRQTAEFARLNGKPVPQDVFTDRMDLAVAGRALELRYVGGGHTVDNIVVWIADQQVLFRGCLVRSASTISLGYTKEADLAAWPQTTAAV